VRDRDAAAARDGSVELAGFDPMFAENSPKQLTVVAVGARNAGVSMVVRLFSGTGWSGISARGEKSPNG
jgi:hypothetical protein